MKTTLEIFQTIASKNIPVETYKDLVALSNARPNEIISFIKLCLNNLNFGGTFFDDCLRYLPLEHFDEIISLSVERIKNGNGNEMTDSVIAHSSLQCPEKLQPFLDMLFENMPNESTYYSNWPWRGIDTENIRKLLEIAINKNENNQKRSLALNCLLESRKTEAIKILLEMVQNDNGINKLFNPSFETLLQSEGYEIVCDDIKILYPNKTYHLQFPKDYLNEPPVWISRNHETWHLKSNIKIAASFGGTSNSFCGICGKQLHRIIELESLPSSIGVNSRTKLELSTCLSCLGWSEPNLFYIHDENGKPTSIGYEGAKIEPEFLSDALKECKIEISLTPQRWITQDWGLSNSRENLFRIGGSPCWIQDAEYLECPKCHKRMSFLMQLDSEIPTKVGGEFLWGSGGIGYIEWCDECSISGYLWQCT